MAVPNEYINLYMDNPTEGREDGILMSLGDDGSSPLNITVNASKNERKVVKLALRCQPGYVTDGDTTVWIRGANSEKWSVGKTADGSFDSAIIITDIINDGNYIFYLSGMATKGELPDVDLTCKLLVNTTIKKLA